VEASYFSDNRETNLNLFEDEEVREFLRDVDDTPYHIPQDLAEDIRAAYPILHSIYTRALTYGHSHTLKILKELGIDEEGTIARKIRVMDEEKMVQLVSAVFREKGGISRLKKNGISTTPEHLSLNVWVVFSLMKRYSDFKYTTKRFDLNSDSKEEFLKFL